MAFVRAERSKLWLRLAIMGPSGSGKTFTALRIAKGIADRIGGLPPAVMDSEGRSASKYADRFTFDADNLDNPGIDQYLASMNECIGAGYKVLVIDSLSHAWKQLLEEVDQIAKANFSGNTWSAWSEGTPKQNKFIQAIVNFPGHVIVTMRSKTEWVLEEGKKGKMVPIKKGMAAQQGKDIEYEFDLLIEMNQDHFAKITKDRTGQFQDRDIEKPGEEFGSALYDWLSAGNSPPPLSARVIEQQCQDAMTEMGTILKTVYMGQRLFTEDELKKAREALVTTRGKNPEERLFFITKFLKEKKEQMRQRVELIDKADQGKGESAPSQEPSVLPPSADQPEPSKQDPPQEPETSEPEVPAMYTENELPNEESHGGKAPDTNDFEDDIPWGKSDKSTSTEGTMTIGKPGDGFLTKAFKNMIKENEKAKAVATAGELDIF
jgi:hypothetical protein